MYPSSKIINIVALIISLVAFTTVMAQNATIAPSDAATTTDAVITTPAAASNTTGQSGAVGIESVCSQALIMVTSLVILLFNFIVSH
ncbi:Hypothetical predicted protein [Octopus vulgaris]|uniref:Uncharacterized protein n=1 Tax=Octopus vulgaris TaxID=6645 RepID=A0AA36AW32_OCTVU|nr:Hypothetical predicted protein [Octopus vulgaris]